MKYLREEINYLLKASKLYKEILKFMLTFVRTDEKVKPLLNGIDVTYLRPGLLMEPFFAKLKNPLCPLDVVSLYQLNYPYLSFMGE